MKKLLIIIVSALDWTCSACNQVIDLTSWRAPDVFGKWAFAQPPELETFNNIRRDQLAGQMPAQATPTEQATRPRDDQRSWLQRFLLPRNTIAFA